MTTTTATPQGTTSLAFSVATMRTLVERGEAAHPDLASRMDKAAALLITRAVERGEAGRVWYVQSETNAEQEYTVTPRKGVWHCTCVDFARRGDWCKHALAVALLRRCQETQGPEPPAPTAAAPVVPLDGRRPRRDGYCPHGEYIQRGMDCAACWEAEHPGRRLGPDGFEGGQNSVIRFPPVQHLDPDAPIPYWPVDVPLPVA